MNTPPSKLRAALLNIDGLVPCTLSEGPGRRFAIYVGGCSIRCAGCTNPHLFDPTDRTVSADVVVEHLREAQQEFGLEGLTWLGGEPTEQAGPAAWISAQAQELGLSVALFSGYTLESLRRRRDPHTDALLAHVDVLIDGPFVLERLDVTRRWIGSTNQQIHFLTGRYSAEDFASRRQGVSIVTTSSGSVATGWPSLVEWVSRLRGGS